MRPPDTTRVPIGPRAIADWDIGHFHITEMVYPPLYRMTAHGHEHAAVSLLMDGAYEEVTEGEAQLAGPGCVAARPSGAVHTVQFGPAGACILAVAIRAGASWPRVVSVCRWWHGPLSETAGRWRRALAGMGPFDHCVTDALVDRTAPPPLWLAAVRGQLHADPADLPDMAGLGRQAGVHAVHLARVFRRYHGCTIGTYVRRLRVLSAAVALATTDQPLARVALTAGFADQAHFCRAFKRETAVTPLAYRRRLRPAEDTLPAQG
jgi:AraC family transcriptional regulator